MGGNDEGNEQVQCIDYPYDMTQLTNYSNLWDPNSYLFVFLFGPCY